MNEPNETPEDLEIDELVDSDTDAVSNPTCHHPMSDNGA